MQVSYELNFSIDILFIKLLKPLEIRSLEDADFIACDVL